MPVEDLPEDVREPVERIMGALQRMADGADPTTDLRADLDEAITRARRTWGTKTTVPSVVRDNIVRLRARDGFSQRDLAEAMDEAGFGWSRGVVSHVEMVDLDMAEVRRPVTVAELLGLTRVFDVGLVDLLTPRSETTVVKLGTASLTPDDLRDLISRIEEGK